MPEAERDAFWHQRQAQARLQMDDADGALRHINLALQDERQPKYHAAFLHDRFLIRRALRQADAIADLEAAIRSCTPGRYRIELEAELVAVRVPAMRD